MASASFHLPDAAPPGNVFPSNNKAHDRSRGLSPVPEAATPTSAVELANLKPDTRKVLVEVTETNVEVGPTTPQPSDFPPPPAGRPPASSDASERRPTTPKRHAPPQLTIQTGATRQSPARSNTSSPTLVRNNSDASEEQEMHQEQNPTPVMRSMFPRFDPSVPLPQQQQQQQQQQSYPRAQERASQHIPPPPAGPPPGHYSPSLYSQTHSPPVPQGQWSNSRMSTLNGSSPLRIAEEPPPDLSSGEELLDLWSVANGQNSNEAKEIYTLGMYCESLGHNQEVIHFTSSTSAIYSLQSSGGNVVLTRTHPLNPQTEITICRPVLQEPTVTAPLLTTVFPCLAELMALDTASNIAITHRLSRADSRALQTEALSRAHASEAAQLLWDSDSAAYYLAHPSLSTATSTTPATLPIQINPNVSITLAGPDSSPVLSLNLTTQVLTIHVNAILLLSPSLYTLDTLLSTLMTLLLHLHRQSSFLGTQPVQQIPLPHFDPPPTSASPSLSYPTRARTKSSAQQHKLSRWFSARSASGERRSGTPTQSTALVPMCAAPHSPALSSMTTPHLVCSSPYPDKDLEAGLASPIPALSTPIPSIPTKGVAPELRKETTGVDLSRFQAFDLSDPELGRGTKVALRVLYWGFGVLVWCLGVGVGVLAAGIVAVGGCAGGGGGENIKNSKKKRIGNGRAG